MANQYELGLSFKLLGMSQAAQQAAGFSQAVGGLSSDIASLKQQASQITAYKSLGAETRKAAAEFRDAQAKVKSLAAETRATQSPSKALTDQFAAAKSKVSALSKEYESKIARLRELRKELTGAGLDVGRLGEAEKKTGRSNKSRGRGPRQRAIR